MGVCEEKPQDNDERGYKNAKMKSRIRLWCRVSFLCVNLSEIQSFEEIEPPENLALSPNDMDIFP